VGSEAPGVAAEEEAVRLAVALSVLVAIAPVPAMADAPSDAKCDAFVEQARVAYEGGKYREALEAERKAYACSPEPGLLYAMGQAAFNLGEYAEADRLYTQFLATNPEAEAQALALQALAVTRERIEAAKKPRPPAPRADRVAWSFAIGAGASGIAAGALYTTARQRASDTTGDFATYDERVDLARKLRIAAIATAGVGAACAAVAVVRWTRGGRRRASGTAISPFTSGDTFGLAIGGRL
jgi:tetratricopeptide (TPR) repeat protein